jgi:hypothetical protein
LDVGRTTSRSGFLDPIIRCASEQIQRKLFSESNDRFGIVLCGTARSKNPLNYEHITLPDLREEGLIGANFSLLEFVEKEVKVTLLHGKALAPRTFPE